MMWSVCSENTYLEMYLPLKIFSQEIFVFTQKFLYASGLLALKMQASGP